MVFKQMRAMELYPSMIPPLPIFIPDLNSSIEAGYAPEPQNETETKRLRLLKELLDTERRYVGDLDLLMDYYTALKTSRICSSEELRGIFSNLEELVEFQHRFLVKLEASAASPYERVGLVFTKLEPQLAAIYAPMCVNLERANKIVLSKAAQLGVSWLACDRSYRIL